MINFGIGAVLLNPVGGNLPVNPTPHQGLTIEEFSIDIDQKLVPLNGQYKFPDDVAPSDMTIKGKFQVGRQDFDMFNNTIFADTRALGGTIAVLNEAHAVPGVTPFTVTVTGSATFQTDLGVMYVGAPPVGFPQALTRVTSGPTQGQYSVSAGVYTFASADASAAITISYTQTNTTVGFNISANNQLQGYGPVFAAYFLEKYYLASNGATPGVIYLPACRFSKLSQAGKRNDYIKPAFEFEAYPNAAGLALQFINPGAA